MATTQILSLIHGLVAIGGQHITFVKVIEHKCANKLYMYNEKWIPLLRVKQPGPSVEDPPPSRAEVNERVKLYL
jgi:hypothetical protein